MEMQVVSRRGKRREVVVCGSSKMKFMQSYRLANFQPAKMPSPNSGGGPLCRGM